MTVAEFSHLVAQRTGHRPRGPNARGWYSGHCPAHNDEKSSLTFKAGDRGIIVKCHAEAGCTDETIAQAVGVTTRDLFHSSRNDASGHPKRHVVARYDYRDENGTIVHSTTRYEPKAFVQSHPDPLTGEPIYNLKGARLVVYRLPEIIAAMKERPTGERVVVVPEGEKDADRLWGLGILATTNPMGAGKWRDEYVDQLKAAGAETVILVADNDRAGESHVRIIERSCSKGGLDARILRLPGLGPVKDKHGEDVSNWLDAGHTREELEALIQKIRRAATADGPNAGSRFTRLAHPLAEPDAIVILDGLGQSPTLSAIEQWLRTLATSLNGADPLRRAVVRTHAIHRLETAGVRSPATLVDAAFASASGAPANDGLQGRPLMLVDPEPWPEAVDGSVLADALTDIFKRYSVLPESGAETLALWTLHTHGAAAAEVSPYLALTSPVRRCGKSRVLTLLSAVVPRPLLAANVTAASLFRSIEKFVPTFLVDEADTFLAGSDELRGILNSGHTRATACILRTVGDDHDPRLFSTWCPKAIALIGTLPETLEDRSIVIPMRRRTKGEAIHRLRLDCLEEFAPMRRRAARWAKDNLSELRAADPAVPGELDDRAADNWRPLLALANLLGGAWPEHARTAARRLSGASQRTDNTPSIMLLTDLRTLFVARETTRVSSATICEALKKLEDRPWAEWKRGKPISPRQLARLLEPYEVRPKGIRIGDTTPKGYELEQFEDAFARYLPTSEPQHAQQTKSDKGLGPDDDSQHVTVVAVAGRHGSLDRHGDVAVVADEAARVEEWGEE